MRGNGGMPYLVTMITIMQMIWNLQICLLIYMSNNCWKFGNDL